MSRSKPLAPDLAAQVHAALMRDVTPGAHVVAALSGGVDSVVLLDCLQRSAAKLGVRVSALHVNHGLSANAGRWESFCRRLCRARGVPFRAVRVRVARGASEEARARDARYAAFHAEKAHCVALAQHRDDQIETLLLQLLRGAGVKGLAGMPSVRVPAPAAVQASGPARPLIVRPLLDATREEILAYARGHALAWIEDESNEDTRHQRNFLRHEVLPVIERRFPQYRATLARSVRHLAEAASLLDALAAGDGVEALAADGTLALAPLAALEPMRVRNLVRFFLAQQGVRMPGAERLEEGLRQILQAKRDAQVRVVLDGVELRRFAGRLHLVPQRPPLPRGYQRRWRGERRLVVPELGGRLELETVRGDGIRVALLRRQALTLRVRRGGERLQPDAQRPRRSLKNLLQEARLPPWERDRLPLLFCGGELVWVAGLGVDTRYRARRGEPGLRPRWHRALT